MRIGERRLLTKRNERWQKRGYNALDPAVLEIAEVEGDDNRRAVRFGVIAGVVLHVVLFLMVFPETEYEPRQVGTKARVYKLRQVQFQPPKPKQQLTKPKNSFKKKAKKIPIPDPTPDDPEPIEVEDVVRSKADFPEADLASVLSVPDGPPGPTTAVMNVEGDVRAPVKVFSPDPIYSEEARQARIQGVVVLQTIIDALGNVADVRVLKGLPSGLTESAIEAVSRWRFRPATLDGEPVSVYYLVTISFSVQ